MTQREIDRRLHSTWLHDNRVLSDTHYRSVKVMQTDNRSTHYSCKLYKKNMTKISQFHGHFWLYANPSIIFIPVYYIYIYSVYMTMLWRQNANSVIARQTLTIPKGMILPMTTPLSITFNIFIISHTRNWVVVSRFVVFIFHFHWGVFKLKMFSLPFSSLLCIKMRGAFTKPEMFTCMF